MGKNLKKTAASSLFEGMSADVTPSIPEVNNTPLTEQPIAESKITPVSSEAPVSTYHAEPNETTFSISLPKKSKKTKLISLRVNENEYAEFSKIVSDMGYNNSELFNQFIRDFIRANRK